MSEKVRVTEIVTKSKVTANPVLLSFQNGELQPNSSNVSFFKAEVAKAPRKEMAVVATDSSIYRGFVNDDPPTSLVNHFLAIKNKATGKVRLVQIDQASLVNDLYYQEDASLFNSLDKEQAHIHMVKNFGGKRAVRALERKQRMKVNIEVVKKQLDNTLEETTVADDKLDQSLDMANMNQIRPPFNADANRIEEVYKLTDIIPEILLEKMEAEANAVLKADIDTLPITSEFLKDGIRGIKNSKDAKTSRNLSQIKAIIYMDALQNLLKSRENNLLNATLSNITERVETDIRSRFVEPNIPIMKKTRYTKEKAICYFTALALLISPSFEIDLGTLSAEMSISRQMVIKYAQLVNAKPVTKTNKLSLRLPRTVKIGAMLMGRRKRK